MAVRSISEQIELLENIPLFCSVADTQPTLQVTESHRISESQGSLPTTLVQTLTLQRRKVRQKEAWEPPEVTGD